MSIEYRHSIFTCAQTDVRILPFNNQKRTLRVVTESNIEAHALTVVFSNRCGIFPLVVGAASLALCSPDGILQGGTLVPLTVDGILDFTIPAGEERESDKVCFSLSPSTHFAINIYYPKSEPVISGNWLDNRSLRSRQGNFSTNLQLPSPGPIRRMVRTVMATDLTADLTVALTTISHIVAYRKTPGRVVACFGDSITQQGTWTAPFAKRLHHAYPGEISLCNLGISGNRLLANSPQSSLVLSSRGAAKPFGPSGVSRFEHDILEIEGLTHVILAIGTNDIGQPGTYEIPNDDVISAPEYAAAVTKLADILRERGVKCYAATLAPRSITPPYTEERELIRLAINDWIRTAPCFDAVLDFDQVLRRPDGAPGINEDWHIGDGLHPNHFGGMHMAKSIDIALFGGEPHG